MAALLLLGVSSVLPLFLTSKTLQAWMTVEKVNLGAIGLFSGEPLLVEVSLGTFIRSFYSAILGRRRGG